MQAGFCLRAPRVLHRAIGLLALLVVVTSCAATSRLHAQHVPEGSLRLGEVMALATRAEILENELIYETLITTVAEDAELEDGTLIAARVFCCGGANEFETMIWAYAPLKAGIEVGDIAEIRSGRRVKEGQSAKGMMPNVVTQVREKRGAASRHCVWKPEDPALWARSIYCDWMEDEGWTQQPGLWNVWIKVQ